MILRTLLATCCMTAVALTIGGCGARAAPPAQPVATFIVGAGEGAPRASHERLAVATYNVHGLRRRDAVRRDLAQLDHVTVWCLQEFPHAAARDLEAILPPGRWYGAAIAVNPDGAEAGPWESQLIASRFPLAGIEVWPLDAGGAKRRVALTARIEVDGRGVLIVNTDHEPAILGWRDGNAVQTRALAERLAEGDDAVADGVVVAGDFNCSGNLYRLRGNAAHIRWVNDVFAAVGFAPVDAPGATFRSGFVRARLDRIYARTIQATAGAIATTARGSDHFPVWAWFEFPAPANGSHFP